MKEIEEGVIRVGGIDIKWLFRPNYIAGMPHIEFRSDVPNPISETGYRSLFLTNGEVEYYSSIQELIREFVKSQVPINKRKQTMLGGFLNGCKEEERSKKTICVYDG